MRTGAAAPTEPAAGAPPGTPAPATYPLTAAIARGDEHAFARFHELWFDRLYAMVRACTRRDEAFCLDVVQECLLRVVHKLPPLPDENAVAAWLARTLLRLAVDALRAEARRAARERTVATARREPLDHDPTSLDAEQQAWLARRLAELPAADRALLHARFVEGHTFQDAAQACGLTADAASGRIRRLVLRLRAAAKEFFDA